MRLLLHWEALVGARCYFSEINAILYLRIISIETCFHICATHNTSFKSGVHYKYS